MATDKSEDLLREILSEVRTSNRLLQALLAINSASSGVSGISYSQRVELLDKAGLSRRAIAEILGTSPNAISVRLHELRKGAKRGKAQN